MIAVNLVAYLGFVTTIAGIATVQGKVDGAYGIATFNYPWAITMDTLGYLYVSGWSGALIRKITPGMKYIYL